MSTQLANAPPCRGDDRKTAKIAGSLVPEKSLKHSPDIANRSARFNIVLQLQSELLNSAN